MINKKTKNWSTSTKYLMILILTVLVVRVFLYQPFYIPSGSMKPNLLEGDRIVVSKYSYGYGRYIATGLFFGTIDLNTKSRLLGSTPKRGDIIVFRSANTDDEKFYIKRLIAFPGETVKLMNSIVYINGKAVYRYDTGENYTKCNSKDSTEQQICRVFEETIFTNSNTYLKDHNNSHFKPNDPSDQKHSENDNSEKTKQYATLDAQINFGINFPSTTHTYVVPKGHYFFLGDNRDHSFDSRYDSGVGIIPEEFVIGKALFIYWNGDIPFFESLSNLFTGSNRFLEML